MHHCIHNEIIQPDIFISAVINQYKSLFRVPKGKRSSVDLHIIFIQNHGICEHVGYIVQIPDRIQNTLRITTGKFLFVFPIIKGSNISLNCYCLDHTMVDMVNFKVHMMFQSLERILNEKVLYEDDAMLLSFLIHRKL